MASVRLETDQMTDWQSFHEVCKARMGFPDIYGMNMNAWIDCLSYLDEDASILKNRVYGDCRLT
jgi:RNAse (barnase) inhibitor barstar